MIRSVYVVMLTILLTLISGNARADNVTLKDGTTHEGTVVMENRAEQVVEWVRDHAYGIPEAYLSAPGSIKGRRTQP